MFVWVEGIGLITLAACHSALPGGPQPSTSVPTHLGLGLGVSACRAAQEVGGGYSQEIFLGFWGGGGGGKGRRKAGDSWLLGLPGLLLTSLHSLAGRTEMCHGDAAWCMPRLPQLPALAVSIPRSTLAKTNCDVSWGEDEHLVHLLSSRGLSNSCSFVHLRSLRLQPMRLSEDSWGFD